ncbi:DEAD/DEAH box helicase [Martelella sp. AD-3]|uniref:DEAD/DEAH box helicase n=1 Tax=Martelella sp. AD-3 TaxID=686597 RepID=UPI000463A8F4|nr:DEAD/DEAH box helicase [Martelella sp. AD-3]AMM87059.1 helicase [Martelella sp. AD-3]MAM09363.1 ATP-dependent helicase [Rhizobiaceae bacterium]
MTPNTDSNATSPIAAIHPALASALAAKGYSALTPVQMAMTNEDHRDVDLLVSAQTGSGKTVAFGIAIAPTLLGRDAHFNAAAAPLGLVIAPTRELAVQVQRELDWLYATAEVRTATCVGGMDMRNERRALDRGAHLVVGTPGRLRDHITRGTLDLSALRAVVLDEADEMLDLGFRDDLEFILGAAPKERRTLLFSATVRRGIAELARAVQTNAVRIETTASTEQHADIEYQLMLVRRDEREHAIINTLLDSDSTSALVFCHTREAVRHLTARLANRGFSVVSLSGEMAQSERSNALQSMRDGRAQVCVATDVAARGIDLPNLDLVVHADVPSNPETLLHRSGRTGRAGRKGVCVLIVPENRRGAVQRVLALAKLTATVRAAPGIADIEARNRRRIIDAAASAAEPAGAEADFVAELLDRAGPERIAAAFLRQQLAAHPVPEELSPLPAAALDNKTARARRSADKNASVREPHGPDMQDGVWFTISLGRKQRADPKFLLPMICNAGGVTKRDVGKIKIDDTETRFEISADKAAGYAKQIKQPGNLERGIMIAPAGEMREKPRQAKPKFRQDGKPTRKPQAPSADRGKTSKHKSRKPKRPA